MCQWPEHRHQHGVCCGDTVSWWWFQMDNQGYQSHVLGTATNIPSNRIFLVESRLSADRTHILRPLH